jgi:hypothetical protein
LFHRAAKILVLTHTLKPWAKLVRPSGLDSRSSSFHGIAKAPVLTHTLKPLIEISSYRSGKPLRQSKGFTLVQLAHIKGFPYYGCMNITLSLDDDLVREVRKIAVERDTTLTGLVRAHLQELAAEHAKSGRKRRELEALRESFEKYQFNMGKRTWKREDLHERR